MAWRNVGPFRGGRATAVAGVPSQPMVYYMGAAGGGLWKTEDAGLSWRNVSDAFFKTGSVGAIAVADSDPNVVFVGMGEAPVRGVATSSGDGVYKSTDAGRTWTHVGLDATRHISRIAIHPTNPDIVYVAAQGSPWAPTPDRGVYKSVDGGKTWKRIHRGENDTSGASDMAMDPTNPRILYVAYWDHQRFPWQMRSGGPGSAIYKTTDGGDTWTKLAEGLPKATMGKIGIAVSPPIRSAYGPTSKRTKAACTDPTTAGRRGTGRRMTASPARERGITRRSPPIRSTTTSSMSSTRRF